VYKLTGKKAVLILDNLRSLSNYKENDSDEYRLINSWLLRLRGQCYTTIVIDHHGKAGVGPRGTSSKTDNANVSILINAVKEKGCPDMVMKVEFDKARGLRPDETEEYEAVYAFNGSWIKQTARKNKNEIDDNHMLEAIYLLKKKEEQEHYARCYTIRTQLEKNEINQSEYNKAEKKLRNFKTQKDLAEFLNISAGKVNQLMQKYRDYLSQKEIAEKTSNY
jgi:hypothetical protein